MSVRVVLITPVCPSVYFTQATSEELLIKLTVTDQGGDSNHARYQRRQTVQSLSNSWLQFGICIRSKQQINKYIPFIMHIYDADDGTLGVNSSFSLLSPDRV